VPFLHLVTETNGVGAGPSDELSRAIGHRPEMGGVRLLGVHTTNTTKTTAYGSLLGMLESEQIVLPRHPDLLRQLAGLRIEQGERGFSRISAEDPATHDDVADALSLAMLPFAPSRSHGRYRCLLPKLAARYPEEADVSELAEPVVATGGGVRVFQRSIVQSVCGTALTVPADLRRRVVVSESARRAREGFLAALAAQANGDTHD
jgi:hypothetical protein